MGGTEEGGTGEEVRTDRWIEGQRYGAMEGWRKGGKDGREEQR